MHDTQDWTTEETQDGTTDETQDGVAVRRAMESPVVHCFTRTLC